MIMRLKRHDVRQWPMSTQWKISCNMLKRLVQYLERVTLVKAKVRVGTKHDCILVDAGLWRHLKPKLLLPEKPTQTQHTDITNWPVLNYYYSELHIQAQSWKITLCCFIHRWFPPVHWLPTLFANLFYWPKNAKFSTVPSTVKSSVTIKLMPNWCQNWTLLAKWKKFMPNGRIMPNTEQKVHKPSLLKIPDLTYLAFQNASRQLFRYIGKATDEKKQCKISGLQIVTT